MSLKLAKPDTDVILIAFLAIGIFLMVGFFFGWANHLYLSIGLIALLWLFFLLIIKAIHFMIHTHGSERWLTGLIAAMLLLNFLPVFVPETGFDALWYHLPLIKDLILQAQIHYLPNLYQSLNPLLAEFYFATGFAWLKVLGAKLIAFVLMILLLATTYRLSRLKLSIRNSLVVTLIVAGFQVVAWQASSVYVDVAKAFFELAGLYFSLKSISQKKSVSKKIVYQDWFYPTIAALFFSASLATKLFSLLLAPTFLLILLLSLKNKKYWWLMLISLFSLALPFYYFSFLHSGQPFYSFGKHLHKLGSIANQADWHIYLCDRLISLPSSFIQMIWVRDYTLPFIAIFFLPIGLKIKAVLRDETLLILTIFVFSQWLMWWFIPPLSTRYALAGFIALLILGLAVIRQYYSSIMKWAYFGLLLSGLVLFLPRLYVLKKNISYLVGQQNQQTYLQKFCDGNIDVKLNAWYHQISPCRQTN